MGPDGVPRLFRPLLNMERMNRSRERLCLPQFCPQEFLKLIKLLVQIESHWIPRAEGYSLYLRPTMVGTRPCELIIHTVSGSLLSMLQT